MKYTLAELCELGAKLEPFMREIGVHVALGGSCMYRGHSDKDMDVILYPHERAINKRAAIVELERIGFRGRFRIGPAPDCTECPDVWVAETSKGRRVDFFFMDRAAFIPADKTDTSKDDLWPDNGLFNQ
jgi:hypothetical protein